MPRVSAVVPVYNVEKFLRPCIDSALAQTLEDIEIVCVDDGSTDSCPQILDDYAAADPRVKVIHKENGGYGMAMNHGMDAATGEYFAVLESDDFIQPDSYEILYRAARRFDAQVVRGDYFDLTTFNGKAMLQARQMTHDSTYYYRPICPNDELEVYGFPMHNWSGIYRMDFLRANGVRYHETPGASYQDNGFFWQVYTRAERLVYVPRPCYCYRIDNPESSIHDPGKVYAMAREFAWIRAYLAQHPEFEQKVLPAYYARLFRAHCQTFQRIGDEHRPAYAHRMREEYGALRDGHVLDTGLFTARERELLIALFEGEEQFTNIALDRLTPFQQLVERKKTHGWGRVIRQLKGQKD
jgi:glycosyltransferase involved in cell wall biosynthesis